ncbi:hypothetical protein [Mesorhizobium sp. L2C089B000]|uniref:hypothetical protein n=1 Tax=Mesorhizobium sp. L2C089B000 TaxID=1287120 RepID=UPI0003D039CC|nr:hypothetical protein [Mesorhizobium sp. L2C089B000]ESZ07238.1 hypothetical protein X736_12935 [Mesorhizobium sp. L2C089B000]
MEGIVAVLLDDDIPRQGRKRGDDFGAGAAFPHSFGFQLRLIAGFQRRDIEMVAEHMLGVDNRDALRAAKLDHLPHRRNAMAGHGHFHDGALIDKVALHVDDQKGCALLVERPWFVAGLGHCVFPVSDADQVSSRLFIETSQFLPMTM